MANPCFHLTHTSVCSGVPVCGAPSLTLDAARAHEVTPGIPREEYQRRRRELIDKLPEGSIAVLVSAPTKYMSGSASYCLLLAQEALTECPQTYCRCSVPTQIVVLTLRLKLQVPPALRLLVPYRLRGAQFGRHFREDVERGGLPHDNVLAGQGLAPGKVGRGQVRLHHVYWTHTQTLSVRSTSFELVQEHCASDDAQPSSSFFATLKATLDRAEHVYVDLPEGASSSRRKSAFDLFGPAEKSKRMLDYISGRKANKTEYDKLVESLTAPKRRPLAPEVGVLRAVKSVHEQKVMRAAAEISAKAHTKVGLSLAFPRAWVQGATDDALRPAGHVRSVSRCALRVPMRAWGRPATCLCPRSRIRVRDIWLSIHAPGVDVS
jgi:hypothetical protein